MKKADSVLGLATRCGFALLAVAIFGLPILLFYKAITIEVFMCVAVMWLVVSACLIFGDDLTEITIWKASIKRDVRAAHKAREEVEAIRDQLRGVSAVTVENSYIISGELLYLVHNLGGPQNAEQMKNSLGMKRLEKNMNAVWRFVEPDPIKAEEERIRFRKEIGKE